MHTSELLSTFERSFDNTWAASAWSNWRQLTGGQRAASLNVMQARRSPVLAVFLTLLSPVIALSQRPAYPAELRGYKVERLAVDIAPGSAEWIRFGKVRVGRVTGARVNMELPIVVSPVRQKGQVDFLVFEDIVVNGTPVRIDEYHRQFNLPNRKELILKEPLRFSVSLPNAMLAAIGEWANSQEKWRVTGRVYVFGRYKKFLFSFKRTIPVELDMTIQNPLKTL